MSIDHRGLSSRKRDILEYIKIFDGFNHTATAQVLLARNHRELDSVVKGLKKQGRYFDVAKNRKGNR